MSNVCARDVVFCLTCYTIPSFKLSFQKESGKKEIEMCSRPIFSKLKKLVDRRPDGPFHTFWSFEIRPATFLNGIKFADLLTIRFQICGWAGTELGEIFRSMDFKSSPRAIFYNALQILCKKLINQMSNNQNMFLSSATRFPILKL